MRRPHEAPRFYRGDKVMFRGIEAEVISFDAYSPYPYTVRTETGSTHVARWHELSRR